MFPWDCGLSQLWGVVLLASQLGWSLSPSAAWSLCSPSWIKQQLHHLGIKFSERSITLNEWKEIKPIKTAASSFISLKTKLTINVFGLAWWGSLRGLLILHYNTVPVVVFHLFQCRVVSLLCLSYVCVPLGRNLHLADAHWIKINCFVCSLYVLYGPLWSERVVFEKRDGWQTCLKKMGCISKSLRKAYRWVSLSGKTHGKTKWHG